MSGPPFDVHRFIEAIASNAETRALFLSDPGALLDRLALEPAEAEALRRGTPEALRGIGVHPGMIFKFLVATGRSPVKLGSARYYLDRL